MTRLAQILVEEGLLKSVKAGRKTASYPLGEITGYSGPNYGDRLSVTLEGNAVHLVVRGWGQIGGSDSPYGASEPLVQAQMTVPANGRAVVAAVKELMQNAIFLQSAPRKDFKWHTSWRDVKIENGLTASKAQMAIDARTMDKDSWRSKWEAPSGQAGQGPFSGKFTKGMISGGYTPVIRVLKEEGYPATESRGFAGDPSGVVLDNGRQVTALVKALQASAKSFKKSRTSDGGDFYIFIFEDGIEVTVAKRFFYTKNGSKWVLQVSA